jgi:hypothetical protein
LSSRHESKPEQQLVGFVGVGLDGKDEHRRVTTSEYFLLVGGSEETHERMQGTAVKFTEALEQRGKTLKEASVEEALDLLRKALGG